MVTIRRVYDEPPADEGKRYLVDRIWPRGIRKEELGLDAWLKDIAPSSDLRKWFSDEQIAKARAAQPEYGKLFARTGF